MLYYTLLNPKSLSQRKREIDSKDFSNLFHTVLSLKERFSQQLCYLRIRIKKAACFRHARIFHFGCSSRGPVMAIPHILAFIGGQGREERRENVEERQKREVDRWKAYKG